MSCTTNTVGQQAASGASKPRLAWATPSLTLFGDVNKLTEGGSGISQEQTASMGMGCNTNPMQFC